MNKLLLVIALLTLALNLRAWKPIYCELPKDSKLFVEKMPNQSKSAVYLMYVSPIRVNEMSLFCRLEQRIRARSNLFLVLRAGSDENYRKTIGSR